MEEQNTQTIEQQPMTEETNSPSFSFVSDEEVAAMQQPQEPAAPAVQENLTVQSTPEVQQETIVASNPHQPDTPPQ